MRFDRQLLLFAFTSGIQDVVGLAVRQKYSSIETTSKPVSNLFPAEISLRRHSLPTAAPSHHGLLRRDQDAGAIRRAFARAEEDTLSTTQPGLVIPAFPVSGSAVTLVEISATASSLQPTSTTTTMTSKDALDVLLSALPSSLEHALKSDASALLSEILAPSTQSVNVQTSTTASTEPTTSATPSQTSAVPSQSSPSQSRTSTTPTTSDTPTTRKSHVVVGTKTRQTQSQQTHTQGTHKHNSHTQETQKQHTHTLGPHTRTNSRTTTRSTPTTTPSTFHTTTRTHATTTGSTAALLSPTTTDVKPGSDPAHPISEAATAGISAGLVAGAVLVGLAGFYLWRRKKAGKPLFGPRGSQRSGASDGIYPKSAWLYDPQITPSRSRAGSEAEQNLLPDPVPDRRPFSEEIEEADLGLPSPSLRADRASSPLLPPAEIPAIMISGDEHPDEGPDGGSGDYGYRSGGRRSRPMMSD